MAIGPTARAALDYKLVPLTGIPVLLIIRIGDGQGERGR
jgi:hypothetical protein